MATEPTYTIVNQAQIDAITKQNAAIQQQIATLKESIPGLEAAATQAKEYQTIGQNVTSTAISRGGENAQAAAERGQLAVQQGATREQEALTQIKTNLSQISTLSGQIKSIPAPIVQFNTSAQDALAAAEAKRQQGQSAFDLLYSEFAQYGLQSLVDPLRQFVIDGLSSAEFALRLRATEAYKKRFAANEQRIRSGLRALSEAEYITLEDQYQNVMRNYGLPANYYARGDMGRQEGFEKFIAGDVSAAELEDRIMTAQNRVINGPKEVTNALRQFFPEITNGDILAYVLDPENSIGTIKRKVAIAEIGGAAFENALKMDVTRASELAKYGVTGGAYREAASNIGQAAAVGSQLAEFYKQTPFDQTTAESAILGAGNSAAALEQVKKLSELQRSSFSGSSGVAGGVLSRDRAGLI